jgi:hypothetical protein
MTNIQPAEENVVPSVRTAAPLSDQEWAEWDAQITRDSNAGKLTRLFAETEEAQHLDWCNIFNELPMDVQEAALETYALFNGNPWNRSFHFGRLGQAWSIRAAPAYRAMAAASSTGFVWSWIGSRTDYDRIIGS